ncbi:ATP-binding protein [Gemmatimonadota bacterium]
MATFKLTPELQTKPGDLVLGDSSERKRDKVFLGHLSESGPKRGLWLDISGEQVVAIFGKRGTGKSYSLGVLLEGLALQGEDTPLAEVKTQRGALVFDLMGIFWSSAIPLTDDGPPEVRKQYELMNSAGLETYSLALDLWVPDGFQNPQIDPPNLQALSVGAAQLDIDDWGALFGLDMFGEPRGMLLSDAIRLVAREGYRQKNGTPRAAKADFTIDDLLRFCEEWEDIDTEYRDETVRSLRQRLNTLSGYDVFTAEGTRLSELVQPGRVSVLLLNRLPDELKKVLVSVLLRGMLRSRGDASFAQKRLDLDGSLSEEEEARLRKAVSDSMPRAWILLDEAHILAAQGEASVAKEMLVKYAKEGRNYGLSMALATQQPAVLDKRLTSQIETLLVHQLTSPDDASVAARAMRSPHPESIQIDRTSGDMASLLRRVRQGEVVFSTGNSPSLARCIVVRIRPRVSAHGGYEA